MNFDKRLNRSSVSIIRGALSHACDGPITPFVLISRAARLASDRRAWDPESVANALHEELTERGWLIDDEDALEATGT